jgi:hypothetical protein
MHSQVTLCDISPIAIRYTFAWRIEKIHLKASNKKLPDRRCSQWLGIELEAWPWWTVISHIQYGSIQVILRDSGRGLCQPLPSE